MTDNIDNIESSSHIADLYKNTYCYTYEVKMVIQILAPDKEIADAKLDREGGYISKRDVTLLDSFLVYDDSPTIETYMSDLENKKKKKD